MTGIVFGSIFWSKRILPLKRSRLFIVVCVLFLAITVILTWGVLERENDFSKQQEAIRQALLSGAAGEITAFVRNYQQRVHIFSAEYTHILEQLALSPEDGQLVATLEKRLDDRFPGYSNYALTRHSGELVLDRFEKDIGAICQSDLKHFSGGLKVNLNEDFNPVYIHPQPGNYHFDVMSGWKGYNQNGIFLVSFPANILARMLKSYQIPGHQLMLVNRDKRQLIEITADGSRDKLDRDLNLNAKEQKQLKAATTIEGSRWLLIDIIDPQMSARNNRALRTEAGLILLIVAFATGLLLLIGRKEK